MQEIPLILSFVLASVFMAAVGGLALYGLANAKNRIIREQRKALEVEQALRRAQQVFMDNAHHELKTPLQIISGNLYLLRTQGLDDAQEKVLARAEAATQRLHSLVLDLLDFTALQQRNITLHPEAVNLGPHLRALESEYEAPARAKGLAFRMEAGTISALVNCDWPRLRRCLTALLDNALRFTDMGSITVTAKVNHTGDCCVLRFEVADTGLGLPADWPRFLQPFEQETGRPHRIPEGLGIGLPLAKGLVEQMGGKLGLSPQPIGTVAWLEVPLEEAGIQI
ncbi:MAG TPA: HAMP domain-containing sensor histidine kinase [Geothrix sp.]|nr:HAMP domain-containing sensor histidine kinase [Geothrix sp.]